MQPFLKTGIFLRTVLLHEEPEFGCFSVARCRCAECDVSGSTLKVHNTHP